MTLKNSIRLYEILDKIYLAGIFLIIIAIILVIVKGNYNFLLIGVSIITFLLKIFRKKIFYGILQNTKYKNVFISVVDKIGEDGISETHNSDFSFYKGLPNNYSTEEFLEENNLKTVINDKWDKIPFIIFSDKNLMIGNKTLIWSNITNWNYFQGNRHFSARIEIDHKKNTSDNISKEYIEPRKFNTTHIEILMLLYHFKKTYDKQSN